MNVSAVELFPYPGYEGHVDMTLSTDSGVKASTAELQETIKAYQLGPGTTMKDINIPGTGEGQIMKLRVITPSGIANPSPVILDIHGGGFVSGSVDIDNYRNIYLAEHTPCIVVSVEYRLASRALPFPAQLLDCYSAYRWLRDHADEIGGDRNRIGVHGTSAGGNLAAGLALYLRDKGEAQPALTVLNCPDLDMAWTNSKVQFGKLGKAPDYAHSTQAIYVNADGSPLSYYAMPALCRNLNGLAPHMVITAEYDPLRDEGMSYALQLLHDHVPCATIQAPRVTHGFCVMDRPLTHWVHNGICAAFRREFGMEITEF